ncbi:MAG: diphosphomevalonate decarboxylase [Sporolactobacillus sp.]
MQAAVSRAYINIALIKYWGKKDEQLILPMNSSLSLTLDAFYTETSVLPQRDRSTDEVIMDGTRLEGSAADKIGRFMDVIREKSGNPTFARIKTNNHVPVASGFASSASGFAALAASAARAYDLDSSGEALSRLARRGSGSASRSIYGGFVKWIKGVNDQSSYAVPIDSADWDLRLIVVTINRQEKKISSREGMKRTVSTSPFYAVWVKEAEKDLLDMEQAIRGHDLEAVGRIAETNALKMHATMLGARPPFTYWEEGTLTAIRHVEHLRAAGIPCFFTIDAGPNVKILCSAGNVKRILDDLSDAFPTERLTTARPGPGVQYLDILSD